MEDSRIIELYWERDQQAVQETAVKYGRLLERIAGNILGRQDAEECVNDTFFKAWELIPPNEPQMLSTFLGKLTRNLAINTRRREFALKRGGGQADAVFEELSELISCDKDIQEEQERKELIGEINAFLRGISKRKRDIFICRYWYCDGVSDIAARFGLSEDNVSVILNRTRKKLRQYLEKNGY